MKIDSPKYEVAMSIIAVFMPKKVYMNQNVFTTTIDAMLFAVSFIEATVRVNGHTHLTH